MCVNENKNERWLNINFPLAVVNMEKKKTQWSVSKKNVLVVNPEDKCFSSFTIILKGLNLSRMCLYHCVTLQRLFCLLQNFAVIPFELQHLYAIGSVEIHTEYQLICTSFKT